MTVLCITRTECMGKWPQEWSTVYAWLVGSQTAAALHDHAPQSTAKETNNTKSRCWGVVVCVLLLICF